MTNQVNQAFEKCDCLNFCGDDSRISKCKVEPCQDYKRPSAIVSAERVYTSGYGSVETGGIDITPVKENDLKNGDFLYSKDSIIKIIEAATQASESEINSLKQRVEELEEKLKYAELSADAEAKFADKFNIQVKELTASNNQLREAGKALVDRWNTPKWKDAEHTSTFIHALEKALSSTPAQSLAEHDKIEGK